MPVDITGKTEVEMSELARTATRVDAPIFYASSFLISFAGNDASIQFMRPHPATLPPFGEPAPFALTDTVAVLQLSLATMKDLSIVLTENIARYEETTKLKIETEFTRRAAQKTP